MIAAYLGGAHTASSSLNLTQPALNTRIRFDNVSFDARSFDSPLYYGYRGGYFFRGNPAIGIEAEFIHLKVYSDPQQRVRVTGTYQGGAIADEMPLGRIVQRYSISHGVNLLLFNLAGRYGVGRGAGESASRFYLIGRFGVGPTIPHTESQIDGNRQGQYEFGRAGWQAAGGAEVRLWRGLYGLAEYKFTRTRQQGKIFSGEAESLLRTHHGVFGLSYHF